MVETANLKVLIADDYEPVRHLLVEYLKVFGVNDVVHCEDGEIALRAIIDAQKQKSPFDMLLIDWNMPVKNGYELLVDLRETAGFDDVLIVMVTANSSDSDIHDASALGVFDYIVKPFNVKMVSALMSRVVATLREKRGRPTG